MTEKLSEGLKLGTFPSFTSISVVDNFYAGLWAGIVQDIEAVVSDFILCRDWGYNSFLQIAENREIIVLHRCAFTMCSYDRHLSLQNDRPKRGRTKDQILIYKRIMNLIFNTTKDIWLEPLYALKGRNPLADLKRRVAGLYLLYYFWNNQIPCDKYKVLIRYSPEDQVRAGVVGEMFLKLENKIQNASLVKNCYKYLVTALSKRNAFSCVYIVDEPMINFQHWQQLYLKNTGMRKCVTSVNANSHFYQILPELEKICRRMTDILIEVDDVAKIPVCQSLFFRKMLPSNMIEKLIKFDEKTLEPLAITLPLDYIRVADVISGLVTKNLLSIERPFLTLDTLLQTDRAPDKIRANGARMSRELRLKHIYNKTTYEKSKASFNSKCEEHRVPKYKISRTKKYREMKSPGWLFINKEFPNIFKQQTKEPERRLLIHRSGHKLVSPVDAVVSNTTGNCSKNGMRVTRGKLHANSTIAPSSKPSTSTEAPVVKRISTRSKRAPENSDDISYKELILGIVDPGIVNRHLALSNSIPEPPKNTTTTSKSQQRPPAIRIVDKATVLTSFDLDEDEKLLQAAIHRSGKMVVGQSTRTLKAMYGLHQRPKRQRGMIDPLSTNDGDLSVSESDELSVVNLESSDDDSTK